MKDKNKQLKKLNRTQLLELLSKQSEEIDSLKKEINKDTDNAVDLPDTSTIKNELYRVKFKRKYGKTLRSTISILITVAAIAILIATLWLPVLQIYGNSMTPNLTNGDIVISIKSDDIEQGDVIAFYYNNKILVKRVIAKAGDWIDIKSDGTVYVNEKELDEPYVNEKSLGECDLTFPYQVPEDRVFVMGDHRSVSVDSRSSSIGCVAEEEIVGKLALKIWPLKDINTF